MGLFEFIVWYVWNWVVSVTATGGLINAWYYGFWGLLWDDDGMMMNEILKMWNGNKVEFPVDIYIDGNSMGEA